MDIGEIVEIERSQTIGTDGYKIRAKPVTTARKAPDEQQIRDTFQTPNYAIDLLIPFIPKHITHVWECASGGRKISRRLIEAGYTVSESDIQEAEPHVGKFNFITEKLGFKLSESWSIITNPPFSIKDLFISKCFDYKVPFALLINADYSQWQIDLIRRGCEKIIPTSRIAYITPHTVKRVNDAEGTDFISIDQIPMEFLYKYSNAQFHSMWLTYGFNLGKTETFVDLTSEQRRFNI